MYEHTFEPDHAYEDAREAVASSLSYAEVLRKLGLRPQGGNHRLFRRYVDDVWKIPTDHFDPSRAPRLALRRGKIPLEDVLVEHSTYSRASLKRRLYDTGLKARQCELCGQGERWRGRHLALVLDHINGVGDDNRLVNLRIVCPNCAATFDTHCGRQNRIQVDPRTCLYCDEVFVPRFAAQSNCSRSCGIHAGGSREPCPARRKVQRPPYDRLLADIEQLGYSAVGRKYGVSDNAVRKWIRWYRARDEAVDAQEEPREGAVEAQEEPREEAVEAQEEAA